MTDPQDLVFWYWDENAEPEACWVALPTAVDEADILRLASHGALGGFQGDLLPRRRG